MDHIRTALGVASLCLALQSCASGSGVDRMQPEIAIAQVGGETFVMEREGRLPIDYEMTIRNTTPDSVTLVRVEMKTTGGGPYLLQSAPVTFHEEIGPGVTVRVRFTMWAWSPGGRATAYEPVVLSGLAWFDSPTGRINARFLRRIEQRRGPTG